MRHSPLYQRHLDSPASAKLRAQGFGPLTRIFARTRGRCECCGMFSTALEMHHLTYVAWAESCSRTAGAATALSPGGPCRPEAEMPRMTYYGLGLTTALVVCEREGAGSQVDFLQDLTIHAGCPASSHPLLPRWVVIGQPCAGAAR
jgi:hypothetical protein